MSTSCGGVTDNGQPCPCRRCVPVVNDDSNAPVICRDCRHIESAHPPPTTSLAEMMNGYKQAAKTSGLVRSRASSSGLKATEMDAIKETNQSSKRRHPGTPDETPGPSRSKKAKGKAKAGTPQGELMSIGMVILMPGGLDHEERLHVTKAPSPAKIDQMIGHGLAVTTKVGKPPLAFRTTWSTTEITSWLERILPLPFSYMNRHLSPTDPSSITWRLLIKSQRSLSVAHERLPSGPEVALHAKKGGKKWDMQTVYIASKLEIPQERYTDWDVDSTDEEDSDHDHENNTPIKPKPAITRKVVIKREPGVQDTTGPCHTGKGKERETPVSTRSSTTQGKRRRYVEVESDAETPSDDSFQLPVSPSDPNSEVVQSEPITLFLPDTPPPIVFDGDSSNAPNLSPYLPSDFAILPPASRSVSNMSSTSNSSVSSSNQLQIDISQETANPVASSSSSASSPNAGSTLTSTSLGASSSSGTWHAPPSSTWTEASSSLPPGVPTSFSGGWGPSSYGGAFLHFPSQAPSLTGKGKVNPWAEDYEADSDED